MHALHTHYRVEHTSQPLLISISVLVFVISFQENLLLDAPKEPNHGSLHCCCCACVLNYTCICICIRLHGAAHRNSKIRCCCCCSFFWLTGTKNSSHNFRFVLICTQERIRIATQSISRYNNGRRRRRRRKKKWLQHRLSSNYFYPWLHVSTTKW